jgi:hypothetical protein
MDDDDPRLTGDHVRRLPGTADAGRVTLVGVVHDHPASEYRARRVVTATDPHVLALELPPLAVPLFIEYAGDGPNPALGGEMSTAIAAAATDRVVGIDGPSLGFTRHLLDRLARDRCSRETVRSVARSLWTVTKDAARCRVAAAVSRATGMAVQADERVTHDCTRTDDPATQADDERAQVRRARTVANAFGGGGAGAVRKAAREEYMTTRLDRLRETGAVTAVVGIGHLGPLTEALDRA